MRCDTHLRYGFLSASSITFKFDPSYDDLKFVFNLIRFLSFAMVGLMDLLPPIIPCYLLVIFIHQTPVSKIYNPHIPNFFRKTSIYYTRVYSIKRVLVDWGPPASQLGPPLYRAFTNEVIFHFVFSQ